MYRRTDGCRLPAGSDAGNRTFRRFSGMPIFPARECYVYNTYSLQEIFLQILAFAYLPKPSFLFSLHEAVFHVKPGFF